MRRLILLTVLTALLSLVLAACGGDDEEGTSTAPTVTAAGPTLPPPPTAATGGGGDVTKVSVVNQDPGGSGRYAFEPSDFSFSVGEKVELTLLGETEFHTFTVDDLSIDEALDAGEKRIFTFTFDKAGKFDIICLSHPQMTGAITVK